MVRPHDEGQAADRNDRPDHHAVAKDVLARMDAQEIRDDAERRQCNDVHLRVAKEPKEMLEENRTAAFVIKVLTERDNGRHEKAGAEQTIERHHDRADEQRRKREQTQHCCGENAPD